MKVKPGSILLVLIYVVTHVAARHKGSISDLVGHIYKTSQRDPLVVVVNTKSNTYLEKDPDDYDDHYITDNGTISKLYEKEAEEEAKYILYNYLLRTKEPDNSEEAVLDNKRNVLRAVLRARCQALVKCKKKCDTSEEKPRKREKYCPLNCKAVFDRLNLCDPPKRKKKKKYDDCDCDEMNSDEDENCDCEKKKKKKKKKNYSDEDCYDCGKKKKKYDDDDDDDSCYDCGKKKAKKWNCDDDNKCRRGKRGKTLPPNWT